MQASSASATDPQSRALVAADCVEATIASLTKIDESGDKRTMNRMARRLGKEQPALLRFAASLKEKHGDTVGEAAVFYATLVWAIFDRHVDRAPRLTPDNLREAEEIVTREHEAIAGLAEKPVQERVAAALVDRQPNIYAKLAELIAEDVSSEAMTAEIATAIFPPTQVVVEAFDAAVAGRRKGEHVGPVVREAAKVGRNDPCPCGSNKKYKKCHGA